MSSQFFTPDQEISEKCFRLDFEFLNSYILVNNFNLFKTF